MSSNPEVPMSSFDADLLVSFPELFGGEGGIPASNEAALVVSAMHVVANERATAGREPVQRPLLAGFQRLRQGIQEGEKLRGEY